MGIEEDTCWDEHWVLYGNQFDNKFHIKKKEEWYKIKERRWDLCKVFKSCWGSSFIRSVLI